MHFLPYFANHRQPAPAHPSGFDWTVIVASGTVLLAIGTAWLAWQTRKLAMASTADQRSQWRPILTVDSEGRVEYEEATGELSFELRNVGRGPAFSVSAQLRSGTKPLAASTPGLEATALAPGERFRLHARIPEGRRKIRGLAVRIDVDYYDVTEYWHKSHLTMVGRRPVEKLQDMSVQPELQIAGVFFEQTNQRLLPVTGSPRAAEEERRANEPWAKRQWHRLRSRSAS